MNTILGTQETSGKWAQFEATPSPRGRRDQFFRVDDDHVSAWRQRLVGREGCS
jgi:hypothetical protein